MWKKWPVGWIMILSRCRSPTPRRYVKTQYPAQLLMYVCNTSGFTECLAPSCGATLWKKAMIELLLPDRIWLTGWLLSTNSNSPVLSGIANMEYGRKLSYTERGWEGLEWSEKEVAYFCKLTINRVCHVLIICPSTESSWWQVGPGASHHLFLS